MKGSTLNFGMIPAVHAKPWTQLFTVQALLWKRAMQVCYQAAPPSEIKHVQWHVSCCL